MAGSRLDFHKETASRHFSIFVLFPHTLKTSSTMYANNLLLYTHQVHVNVPVCLLCATANATRKAAAVRGASRTGRAYGMHGAAALQAQGARSLPRVRSTYVCVAQARTNEMSLPACGPHTHTSILCTCEHELACKPEKPTAVLYHMYVRTCLYSFAHPAERAPASSNFASTTTSSRSVQHAPNCRKSPPPNCSLGQNLRLVLSSSVGLHGEIDSKAGREKSGNMYVRYQKPQIDILAQPAKSCM